MTRTMAAAMMAMLAAGCSYQSTASVSPAYNVYTNYGERVPGRFALMVDGDEMGGTFKVRGFACSAHSYPVAAGDAFRQSVFQTFEVVFEHVELVQSTLTRQDLLARGLDGFILVRAQDYDVTLTVIPGFWTADMEAEAEIATSIAVDSPTGRVFGTTVAADGELLTEAGSACEGGATAIGGATEEALEQVVRAAAERLANSERVRSVSIAAVPTS